jgi:hypothetical protein
VNGQVKKQIDNPKFYHTYHFHKRTFLIDFAQASLFIFKDEKDSTPQKTIDLYDILAISKYEPDEDEPEPEPEREMKKSKSTGFFGSFFGGN